jgi:hypothetical protein
MVVRAISPENRDPIFPDRAQKPEILSRLSKISSGNRFPLFRIVLRTPAGVQKGSPAKRTGHTLRVAAQYIQKTPKINGLLVVWLIDFEPKVRVFAGTGGIALRPPSTDCRSDQHNPGKSDQQAEQDQPHDGGLGV